MKIEPPSDDYNVQRLKRLNQRSNQVHQADHVEPYPRVIPARDSTEQRGGGRAAQQERRNNQRRGDDDRRREQREVLLDTRDNQERRGASRRTEDRPAADARSAEPEQEEGIKRPPGIDTMA